MNRYEYVNLSGLYNHKAFMRKEDFRNEYQNSEEYCVAVNRFLDPAVSLMDHGKIAENSVAFDLSFLSLKEHDNIYCLGQVVNTPPGIYKKISLLGFSEYGNCIDTVIVQYRGSDVKQELGMLDFGSYKRDDDLGFATKYNCTCECHTTATKVNDLNNEVSAYLFSSTYEINDEIELSSIVLPMNELIHIAAITLIRAE